MPNFTEEQQRIIKRLDRALKDAAKAGLALRVFDGSVMMMNEEALTDQRYGEFGDDYAAWCDDCTQRIGIGLDADGGAGS